LKIKEAWEKVRHVETPRRVKIVLVLLIVYLASPIDLIPDFIPVLGQLDDIIISVLVLRWVSKHTTFNVKEAV
jgi:uncharacterized membrane protein YkvA (DUF1232 family)